MLRTYLWIGVAVACLVLAGGATFAQPADVRMVTVEGEGAKYWPVWRGPSGQGLATGSYPDSWSATENVAWKKPVPGRGNSSPIVWGDRIFLTTAYDSGRRVSLVAFRRTDGTQLWETFAPDGRTGRPHYKNGHASATPSTDGKLIYAFFGSRGLAAFDFNGKLVWHQDLGDVDNYHGSAGSPLLYKNRAHPLSGFRRRIVHRLVRHGHGQAGMAHAAPCVRRLGHTRCGARWHARRDRCQQPVFGDGLRSGNRPGALGL